MICFRMPLRARNEVKNTLYTPYPYSVLRTHYTPYSSTRYTTQTYIIPHLSVLPALILPTYYTLQLHTAATDKNNCAGEGKMEEEDFEYTYSDEEGGTAEDDECTVEDAEEFTVDDDERMEEWNGGGTSPASSTQAQHTAIRTTNAGDPNAAPCVIFKGTSYAAAVATTACANVRAASFVSPN